MRGRFRGPQLPHDTKKNSTLHTEVRPPRAVRPHRARPLGRARISPLTLSRPWQSPNRPTASHLHDFDGRRRTSANVTTDGIVQPPQRVGGFVALKLMNPGAQWLLVSARIHQRHHHDDAGMLWRRHNRPTTRRSAILSYPCMFLLQLRLQPTTFQPSLSCPRKVQHTHTPLHASHVHSRTPQRDTVTVHLSHASWYFYNRTWHVTTARRARRATNPTRTRTDS